MTEPGNIKLFIIGILVLIVVYMILRNRTERIRRHRSENRSKFGRNR